MARVYMIPGKASMLLTETGSRAEVTSGATLVRETTTAATTAQQPIVMMLS